MSNLDRSASLHKSPYLCGTSPIGRQAVEARDKHLNHCVKDGIFFQRSKRESWCV